MRIFNVQPAARPTAIDRNHTNQTKTASTGAVAPHAPTTRWTYTVPVGKKAQVQTMCIKITRVTAAAPVGPAEASVNYTPNGGAVLALHDIVLVTNGVNDTQVANNDQLGDMDAGDVLAFVTQDASTGGTVGFLGSCKIFEYDA